MLRGNASARSFFGTSTTNRSLWLSGFMRPLTSAMNAPPSLSGTWKLRMVAVPPATWISGSDETLLSVIVSDRRRSSRFTGAASGPEGLPRLAASVAAGATTMRAAKATLRSMAGLLLRRRRRIGGQFLDLPLRDREPVGMLGRSRDDRLDEVDRQPIGREGSSPQERALAAAQGGLHVQQGRGVVDEEDVLDREVAPELSGSVPVEDLRPCGLLVHSLAHGVRHHRERLRPAGIDGRRVDREGELNEIASEANDRDLGRLRLVRKELEEGVGRQPPAHVRRLPTGVLDHYELGWPRREACIHEERQEEQAEEEDQRPVLPCSLTCERVPD